MPLLPDLLSRNGGSWGWDGLSSSHSSCFLLVVLLGAVDPDSGLKRPLLGIAAIKPGTCFTLKMDSSEELALSALVLCRFVVPSRLNLGPSGTS